MKSPMPMLAITVKLADPPPLNIFLPAVGYSYKGQTLLLRFVFVSPHNALYHLLFF